MQLKEIRNKKGLSVPQLAELSGVPRQTIQCTLHIRTWFRLECSL